MKNLLKPVVRKLVLNICWLLISMNSLHAEVVTDGTLGQAAQLTGPNFQINSNLGQQLGGNLFHSFSRFDVNTGETATFTGPDSVTNILARVTGGQRSLIDGTLRSTIPNANLYLLNPNGILFGERASLDISGSFHASTANYVRLGEEGRFYTNVANPSTLTVAPPSVFGFLDQRSATIAIQGSFLRTLTGKTLSLVSGDVSMQDGTLFAPSGRINLASVASEGEVNLDSNLTMNSFGKLGKIDISLSSWDKLKQNEGNTLANIDASGTSGGQVFIRAGQLFLDQGFLFADNYGDGQGFIDIDIRGEMLLANGARITADNIGSGQVGSINIRADGKISLQGKESEIEEYPYSNFSAIATNSYNLGEPENIVKPGNRGKSGDIRISTPVLQISRGLIQTTATNGEGYAGNIWVDAQQVILDRGFISALATQASGGDITFQVRDTLSLSDSTISAEAQGDGNGGNLTIQNPQMFILGNSQLFANARAGKGGNIRINTDHFVRSGDSQINVFSTLGMKGELWSPTIYTPPINYRLPLSEDFLATSANLLLNRCSSFSKENLSRFIIGRDIPQETPYDLQTHWVLPR